MKYISSIIMCLICTTSFSQLVWKSLERPSSKPATNALNRFDSTVSKKIVIMFTANKSGKVIATSYVRKESTSAEEQLINNAKLMTLKAKPIIHMPDHTTSYYGSYTYVFKPGGELIVYFQNNGRALIGTTAFVSKRLRPSY